MYRTYRPKTFGELIGQEEVVEVLRNAAREERLAHAYLFYGSRGSGKTTAARLVAKVANCTRRASEAAFRETGEPCNECVPCREIDEGRGLDVVEIDAASNRGIDEIRDLKEGIRLAPLHYRYKVFIIDEVHQLTKDAFNALLKTLEEPPAHAIFILATTEFEKVPATVVSRTQRFNFRRLPIRQIVEKLERIVEAEKVTADREALELIASSAEGSFRDAESLLDQAVTMTGAATVENVERMLGRAGFTKLAGFADALVARDAPRALAALAEANAAGRDLVALTKELIRYLRRVVVLSASPAMAESFRNELTKEELETVQKHAASAKRDELIRLLKSLIEAWRNMRYSPFAIVPLEVAIIEELGS